MSAELSSKGHATNAMASKNATNTKKNKSSQRYNIQSRWSYQYYCWHRWTYSLYIGVAAKVATKIILGTMFVGMKIAWIEMNSRHIEMLYRRTHTQSSVSWLLRMKYHSCFTSTIKCGYGTFKINPPKRRVEKAKSISQRSETLLLLHTKHACSFIVKAIAKVDNKVRLRVAREFLNIMSIRLFYITLTNSISPSIRLLKNMKVEFLLNVSSTIVLVQKRTVQPTQWI